ncbi:MAG: hypothetical protein VX822_05095 [Candidatus Neomarinimicrobiota bacterium]|nr:hypothetical protein [Candidatus Neomarinimicrobiota bacterium]
MSNWTKQCLVVFTAFTILCTSLNAQIAADAIRISSNEIGFGARALAMGSAYTAIANDFSAIYWNPAGLAAIPVGGMFAEGVGNSLSNKITYVGTSTPVTDQNKHLGAIGLMTALPTIRGSFVIGVGINRIASYDNYLDFSGLSNVDNGLEFTFEEDGQYVFYPFNKNVLRSEKVRSIGGVDQISLGVGIALSPRTAAGLSISSVGAREEYIFVFNQKDSENKYNTYPADFHKYLLTQDLSLEGTSTRIRGGILSAITPQLKVGATIALPSTFEIAEQHLLKEELTFDDESTTDSTITGFWEYRLRTPSSIDVGLAFTGSALTLSTSARLKDWASTQFDLKKLQSGTPLHEELKTENRILSADYRTTVELRAGVEYILRFQGMALSFRGGYVLIPSSLRDPDEMDREYFTGGIALSPNQQFIVNLAYLATIWERNSSDKYTPSGTIEELTQSTIVINATLRL